MNSTREPSNFAELRTLIILLPTPSGALSSMNVVKMLYLLPIKWVMQKYVNFRVGIKVLCTSYFLNETFKLENIIELGNLLGRFFKKNYLYKTMFPKIVSMEHLFCDMLCKKKKKGLLVKFYLEDLAVNILL